MQKDCVIGGYWYINDGRRYISYGERLVTIGGKKYWIDLNKKAVCVDTIYDLAPKADYKVRHAFEVLGFEVVPNKAAYYSGYFDLKDRKIELKDYTSDHIYHELGHFLSFIAGDMDDKAEFLRIYNEEKGKYTKADYTYATSTPAEYFASSYKEWCMEKSRLKRERPKTYYYIMKSLSFVTDTQLKKTQEVYGPIWK